MNIFSLLLLLQKAVAGAVHATIIFLISGRTKQAGKGTGLGLSISYGIVKDCRGSIKVKPHASGGACFILEFPVPEKTHGKNDPIGR